MQTGRRLAIVGTFLAPILFAANLFGAVNLVEGVAQSPGSAETFPLVAGGVAALIVAPADAPEVVKIAACDLASDIDAVTGVKPDVLTVAPTDANRPRIELVFSPDLAGRWEAFRLSAKPGILTIAGSDRRGLAYGIYEISKRIGVSPWHWWADVPVRHR